MTKGKQAFKVKVWILAAVAALGGCASEALVPASGATVLPGSHNKVAYDRNQAVSVFVNGDAWTGIPGDLETVMTPIKVTVTNSAQHPIRIAYKDFELKTENGMATNPMSPFAINPKNPGRPTAITAPAFGSNLFYLAPWYGPYYPHLTLWGGQWALDPNVYESLYQDWQIPLPTEDMLKNVIPEGVLDPGGSVTGFLYFPKVAKQTNGTVVFRANLPESGGPEIAKVDIPLRVKR